MLFAWLKTFAFFFPAPPQKNKKKPLCNVWNGLCNARMGQGLVLSLRRPAPFVPLAATFSDPGGAPVRGKIAFAGGLGERLR